jgi:thioesterase domain-containing protein
MSSTSIPDTICEIQDAPSSAGSIPLVLIHDGGGTVFNYWTLGPLHRQMYGISDPAFDSGAEWKGWEGGLKQMAELYCNMIRKEIGKGKILLGGKYSSNLLPKTFTSLHIVDSGWSLGGLISLEMSRIFAESGDIVVQGIVMIDTPNFSGVQGQQGIATKDLPQITSSPSPRIRANVLASMARSQVLISGWDLPQWDSKKAPPTVLIRATDCVPVPSGSSLRAFVDLTRDLPKLGWEEYHALNVTSVLDVHDVHHFNMFSLERVCDPL